MSKWVIGIDPGRSGAAVALAPDGFAEVLWSWRTSERWIVLKVAQVTEEGIVTRTERVRSPHTLGQIITSGLLAISGGNPILVYSEAIYVKLNTKTGIGQALWLGKVLGPLEDSIKRETVFLPPSLWRKTVGINNRLKGKDLKAEAVTVIGTGLPGLKELVESLKRTTIAAHDFEAGGIAWAGSKI